MRVYNLLGRRDNMFKARIKILVHETGTDKFTEMVEEEWQHLKDDPAYELPEAELQRLKPFSHRPPMKPLRRRYRRSKRSAWPIRLSPIGWRVTLRNTKCPATGS